MSRAFAPPIHPQPRKPAAPAVAPAVAALRVSQPGDAVEQDAAAAARRALRGGPASAPPTRPAVASLSTDAATGEGRPLDPATRGWFEPRFGHDFGRVRVHAGARAGASARALNADAYTLGSDIVFAPGRYAPHTSAGRALLAHELAHVAQPPSTPMVLRKPAGAAPALDEPDAGPTPQEVQDYQAYLNENKDTEEMPTSRDRALVLARRRLRGEAVALPANGDALLVLELLYGAPLHEHRAAALGLLDQMDATVLEGMVSRAPEPGRGKINVWQLAARFEGVEMFQAVDILSGRLHGGYDELRKGTAPLKKAGEPDMQQRTLKWLETSRQSAEDYFRQVWESHDVVSLGETHHQGPAQLEFAADMVTAHGGQGVTLAMELPSQAAVDAYMQNREEPKLPSWVFEHGYDKLLNTARKNRTRVVAADRGRRKDDTYSPARDRQMAKVVGGELKGGQKVLYYGGLLHVREWTAHHTNPMGRQLAVANGERSYAITMQFYDPGQEAPPLIEALRERFPSETSIGFDVDQTPMRWTSDPDLSTHYKRTEFLGKNIDGLICFLK
ncbi:MAG TPA: DUF4157 domain-containing protein [Longimicrobium sp.]|nr:DUF4157 domain-containing protein [Longimicrobium sp.]